MSEELKCLRCGGANMAPGDVQTTGVVRFRPDNTKFWTLQTGDVPVKGFMCTDCGTLAMVGDTEKEKALEK